jgi:hypothetical protein
MNTTFQEKRTKNSRYFEDGQSVIARDYKGKGSKLTFGIIKEREGPLMYKVEIEPGTIWRRHIYQLRDSEINENNIEEPEFIKLKCVLKFRPKKSFAGVSFVVEWGCCGRLTEISLFSV